VNREGTLHFIRNRTQDHPDVFRFQVGFADYASPGGAMKTKELASEQALRDFLTSIGIQPMIVESVLSGLRSDGTASILNVTLSEQVLVNLGLADETPLPVFPVRFTVFREPQGPVLAFCPAFPFSSATFASKAGVRFMSDSSLRKALEDAGLPANEITSGFGSLKVYNVNRAQLSALGFKPSTTWWS